MRLPMQLIRDIMAGKPARVHLVKLCVWLLESCRRPVHQVSAVHLGAMRNLKQAWLLDPQ